MLKCPKCGAEMIERTAKKGKNAGNKFWGCSKFPACRGVINIEDPMSGSNVVEPVEGTNHKAAIRESEKFAQFAAEPLTGFDYMKSFETLACDEIVFSKMRNRKIEGRVLKEQAKFRIDFPEKLYSVERNHREISALVLRMLCRGRITINSEYLERTLKNIVQGTPDYSDDVYENLYRAFFQHLNYAYDSEREEKFANVVFKEVIGDNWNLYVTPQAYLSSLVDSSIELKDFVNQRVDFLVSVPNGDYIIELDGQEHESRKAIDSKRDEFLANHGYKIFRFKNEDIDENIESVIAELTQFIGKQPEQKKLDSIAEQQAAALKIAHQLQIAIVSAIESGAISYNSTIGIFGDIKGLPNSVMYKIAKAASDDLKMLYDSFCELYAQEKFYSVSVSEKPDIVVCFGSNPENAVRKIMVSDTRIHMKLENVIPSYKNLEPTKFSYETLKYFLKYIYRFDDFKEGQFDAMERIFMKKDSIILLPTGSGKSLIYQLTALLVPGKTFIVSPLISLMRDQLDNLESKGIDCAIMLSRDTKIDTALNSTQNVMIYLTPERLQIDSFRDGVESMLLQNMVYTVAIDEAHCVSEWGHDFRTAYLNIGRISKKIFASNSNEPSLIALTGTASAAVLKDIKRELQITEYDAIITPKTFDRSELKFKVFRTQSVNKPKALENIMRSVIPDHFGETYTNFYRLSEDRTNCGIVFCPHVAGNYGVMEVQKLVSNSDYFSGKAPKKYIGDWEEKKRQVAELFKSNSIGTLIATKAFGMGIDKPNVRFTVHYGVPGSIEAFYQEAGRAGRDHGEALCMMILSKDNESIDAKLLDPTTLLADVAEIVNGQKYDEADDVSRMLYFHINSFKGIKMEKHYVEKVVDRIFIKDELINRPVEIDYEDSDELSLYQKAIQRLLVLGIVSDCTIDYNRRSLKIITGTTDQIYIEENYAKYVRGYNEGRVFAEMKKMDDCLGENASDFAKDAAEILIHFIYDTVEKGRRRGLREMIGATEAALNSKDPDMELRQRIVRYFESTYMEEIDSIVESKSLGYEVIKNIIRGTVIEDTNEVIGGLKSSYEAAGLRGEVSRHLESLPDHPGLLALRAISEMYCKEADDKVILDDFNASISFALERYSYSKQKLVDFVVYFMKEILQNKQNLFTKALEYSSKYMEISPLCEKLIDADDLEENLKTIPAIFYFSNKAMSVLEKVNDLKGE